MFKKLAGALGIALIAGSAQALVITPEGAALGFTTASVVSGFPFNGLGPIGITVLPNGNILANSVGDGRNYVFKDQNGQAFASHIAVGDPVSCCGAYATSNGWAWGGNGGTLTRFNNDGTIAQSFNGIAVANGVWTNPVDGHLIVAAGGIFDIDVSNINAPSVRAIPGTSQGDGLTVSPDGTIVYTSSLTGYNIQTGARVFSHGVSGADGLGIIVSKNSLNGKLVSNTTVGLVILTDPTHWDANGNALATGDADVIIANQGARGDYATPDATDGSLLLTQGADIWRLSCGADCGIGAPPPPPPPNVPEPASIALLVAGLAGLRATRNRKSL